MAEKEQQLDPNPAPFKGQQFRGKIKLPLTEEVRYWIFRKMVWNYSLVLISRDDYKLLGRPKKEAFGFACVWTALGAGLHQVWLAQPEKFYKKFLLTAWPVAFGVVPATVFGLLYRRQNRINHEVYERTVGHLTDRELIDLDMQYTPGKRLMYENAVEMDAHK